MGSVAVIGSGISGLACARALSLAPSGTKVTLFEAEPRAGGHAHTVDVTLEGVTHGVDTGFLVYNERTYPGLIRLFGELGVQTADADMSFSVQLPARPLEWSGSSLSTVFAQRRNLLRPGFWRMLNEIRRFNKLTTALATTLSKNESAALLDQSVGEFLDEHHFSEWFRQAYFLPMVACIWSCPTDQMLAFPMATMIRFCHNHGLLQVTGRPQWRTVAGGSKHYVAKMLSDLPDVRLGMPVMAITPDRGRVVIQTAKGFETFDDVVLACHSDQALALLGRQASLEQNHLLGAIRYQANLAILHTDTRVLPQRESAWAAWNYESGGTSDREEQAQLQPVCLHYLINKLQPLPWKQPVIVSLNPLRSINPACVIQQFEYMHPVFDRAAITAQKQLDRIQGLEGIWFCGAWTGYGFHEDGLRSGLEIARRLLDASSMPDRAAA